MRRAFFGLAIAAIGLLATAGSLAASEKEDAAAIERLRAEIEHQLPAGWSVAIDPALQRQRAGDAEAPALVIRSSDKLPTESQFPNAAPGQEPFRESQVVEIVLEVRPPLTVEQYGQERAKIDERIKSRTEAERKLRGISFAYKGAAPMPPSAFRPKDDREQRLVLEYALLWNRTEPERLPTHYRDGLSFELILPLTYSVITDKAKAKEYNGIVASLGGLLKAYEQADSR